MQQLFGDKVQDYYVRRLRANAAERKARLDKIQTPEQFKAYQQELKEKIRNSFQLPTEKTPLSPRITCTLQRDGFRVENVIYHSRPRLPVTANLYIPEGAANAPAVLFLAGHSVNGKASDTYQRAILNLVANGFVVLAPDPSGQGERAQLVDVPHAEEFAYRPTFEHNMINKQMLLVGEFYTSWCVWDAVRSYDYLESRPEVDPKRICITGNSGGGNMSAFMSAVDDRAFAIAPSCYVTTWLHNVENEEPACAEQEPQFFIGHGCEMGDLLLANAPRPLLLLGQKNDFFDVRGTAETYEEVKRFYEMLGEGDKIKLFVGPTNHGYHRENRDAMYDFFTSQLGLGTPKVEKDDVELFSDAELQVTPTGQTAHLDGELITIDFARNLADDYRATRPELTKAELQDKVREMLRLDEKDIPVPFHRNLKYRMQGCRLFSRFGIETEENMLAILHHMPEVSSWRNYLHFPREFEHSTLYIPHVDSVDEMLEIDFKDCGELFGLDVRGVGELMPLSCNYNSGHAQPYWLHPFRQDSLYSCFDNVNREFFSSYCCDYDYSAIGLMLNEPYLGGRVRDILSTVKLMKHNGHGKIDIVAKGQGTIPAIFAALLSDDIKDVTLIQAPESFDSMLRTRITYVPQSVMPWGVLKFTDMPELIEAVGAKVIK